MRRDIGDNSREMIEFACRWLPYGGGPDEEILVTFGMPAYQFYDRLARILDGDDPSVTEMLTEPHATTLRALCRTRSRTRRTQSVGQ
ncbi:DUF3263 domain-containing protein [Rhodococcus sp. NBC_00294]|uniref:DUF3263 domain-containing protein n=1 Tax=Rhodococcus sp. NBC_00294 TaxID=2976004 RepID=UPI002E2E0BBB|nr:DUF3263 domain-containing protein [Rhodococcus sp. NBC_00294]